MRLTHIRVSLFYFFVGFNPTYIYIVQMDNVHLAIGGIGWYDVRG